MKKIPNLKNYKYEDIKAGEPITWNIIKTEKFGEIWIADQLIKKCIKFYYQQKEKQ